MGKRDGAIQSRTLGFLWLIWFLVLRPESRSRLTQAQGARCFFLLGRGYLVPPRDPPPPEALAKAARDRRKRKKREVTLVVKKVHKSIVEMKNHTHCAMLLVAALALEA